MIPYAFSEAVAANDTQTDLIRSAMQEWEQKTCVTFQPYSLEEAEKLDQRVIIKDKWEGCQVYRKFRYDAEHGTWNKQHVVS